MHRTIVLILAVFSLVQDSREELKRARAALRAGKYVEAERSYRKIVASEPHVWEPRLGLLHTLLETGRRADAMKVCEEYLKAHPDHRAALAYKGALLFEKGDEANALEVAQRLLSRDSSDVRARLVNAGILMKAKQEEDARESLEPLVDFFRTKRDDLMKDDLLALVQALRLMESAEADELVLKTALPELLKPDPDNPPIKTALGHFFLEKRDFAQAEKCFREALAVNPRLAGALAGMAALALEGGGAAEAIRRCDSSLAVRLTLDAAYRIKALAQIVQSNREGALQTTTEGLRACPSSLALLSFHAALRLLSGDEKGIPPSPRLFLEAGHILVKEGREYRRAQVLFKKALDLNPGFRPALSDIGLNALRLGDDEAARKNLEAAAKRDPLDARVAGTLDLLRAFRSDYETFPFGSFVLRLGRHESGWIRPYAQRLLEMAWTEMTRRYGFEPDTPIRVDILSTPAHFSARAAGIPIPDLTGVCFGDTAVILSPGSGTDIHWGTALWHQMAHVFARLLSDHRVPFWLAEGLAGYEEKFPFHGWRRPYVLDLLKARASGRLKGIATLESAPNDPLLASWLCEFLHKEFGFEKISALLKGYAQGSGTSEVFTSVFGISLDEIDKRFLGWVDTQLSQVKVALPPLEDSSKLTTAAEAEPKGAEANAKAAWALLEMGKVNEALRYAKAAVEAAPEDSASLAVLGQVLWKKREWDDAVAILGKAVERGRDDYHTWCALGESLKGMQRPKEAVAAFEKADGCLPPAAEDLANRQLAALYAELGQNDRALEHLHAIVAANPLDVANRIKVARRFKELGASEKVHEVALDMVYIQPRDPLPNDLMAWALGQEGKYDAAVEAHRVVVAIVEADPAYPDRDTVLAEKYCDIAEAYLAGGHVDKARDYAKEGLKSLPGMERARKIYERAQKK